MKTRLLLFAIASFASVFASVNTASAQNSFVNVYGGIHNEQGQSIERYATGGFLIGGQCNDGLGGTDISLTKVDEYGNLVWCKKYGTPLNDRFCDIALTTSKQCYVLCDMRDPQNNGVTVIKTDSLGNTIWCHVFNDTWSSRGVQIESTSDGGFVMTCEVDTLSPTGWYCYKVVRCNSSGTIRCSKIFAAGTVLNSVLPCPNGDIIVAGSSLVRLDSMGNILSSRFYSSMQPKFICDVEWYANDLIVLWSEPDTSHGPYYYNITAGRLDQNGNVLWAKKIDGGRSFLWSKKLSTSASGIITITANTNDTVSWSGVIVQLDITGVLLGSYAMVNSSAYFADLIATSVAECVIAGSLPGSFSSTDSGSVFLMRTSPDELICGMTLFPVTFNSDPVTYQLYPWSNYNSGWSVAGYYPSASGSTMMNLCAVGIGEEEEQAFSIFPVPLQTEFVVSGNDLAQSEFVLMDVHGRVVQRIRLTSDRNVINCDDLTSGVYLFEILSNDGVTRRSGKLVKN